MTDGTTRERADAPDTTGERSAEGGSGQVDARADDHPLASDAVVLLRELVRRPSVTPADGGCQTLIGERLARLGFALEPMAAGGVTNLWARLGERAPLVVLAGHTDVVPTGEESAWTSPPFAADVVDGHVVGRGAADMKGGVAAMITAIERHVRSGGPRLGSIGVLLTSDEEGPATSGTVHVIDTLVARGERIDHCLITEPSSTARFGDTIRNGRRGSLGATLVIAGVQGHVAYPHLADNPVHRASAFLAELVGIEWDEGGGGFPPTTLQVSNIHAGTGATNVIPGSCTVELNLRHGTASPAATIRHRIEALVERHALDATIRWKESAAPFVTEPGTLTEALRAAIVAATGVEPALDTGGGTSDGRFIATTGAQVVEFGPLNATIHQIDERVDAADVASLSCIIEDLLGRMLGDDGDRS